jgi:hypothetical protein
MLFSLGRASVLLRAHVKRRCLGEAMGCTVVEDDGIVVAVPRLGRSRIVLSRAALELMDREELEASIAHEQAHTTRGHRSILVLGSLLAASGRLLPGTRAAENALILSIERDADEYAVRETQKPLALASAICKAAGDRGPASAFAALAGRGGLAVRLEYLVSGGRQRTSVVFERTMLILAALMCAVTITLIASLPAWALAHPADDAFASAAVAQCDA